MPTALVTGAGRGIGRAIAAAFAKLGHDVIVADIDAALAERTAAEIGGRAVTMDVTDPESVAAVARDVASLDVLVNNAGIVRAGVFPDVDLADHEATMAVNVRGPLVVTQGFTPALEAEGGGAVVNVASMSALTPVPGTGTYAASKAAVAGLTTSLAVDLAARGIRVNAVAPGRISTEMTAARQQDPEVEKRTNALIPLGRSGEPEDIADVVCFLASPQARYVTGQTIAVDGGLTIGTVAFFSRAQKGWGELG